LVRPAEPFQAIDLLTQFGLSSFMARVKVSAREPSPMTGKSKKTRDFNASEWMSKGDAARARGVSRQAIWELVHRGRLTTCVVAGRLYVSRAEVMNFTRRPRGPAANYKSRKTTAKLKTKHYDAAKWISLIEAARLAGVTRQVIADLIRRRSLRTLAAADKTLVSRAGLESFMQHQRRPEPNSRSAKTK
jgi:predicted DNA-binding protein YlxM (UPF0122 family)